MRLWVRLLGAGTDEDPYRPEAPRDSRLDGVRITTVGEAFTVEDRTSPRYGHPLGSEDQFGRLIQIEVPDAVADVFVDAIPESSVPEALRFICGVVEQLPRDSVDPRFADGPGARALFAGEAARTLTVRGAARQQVVARALKEAADRGLRAEDVTAIGREHGIAG